MCNQLTGADEQRKAKKIENILKDTEPHGIQNRAICFLSGNRLPVQTAGSGLLGTIQNFLKQYGKLYYVLIEVLMPVYSGPMRKRIKKILHRHDEKSVILNLGSGPDRYMGRKDIINIDAYAFNEVDMVADAADIPIVDNSADIIINLGLLEHVKNPETVVSEMHRIIKCKGEVFCFLPFLQPFHAAPNDFQRWTEQGAKTLFSCFDEVEISIAQGPTSSLLWILQEWLSIFFSFGSRTIHDIWFLLLMVVFAPLKMLDVFMVKFPCADKIANGFYVVARKLK